MDSEDPGPPEEKENVWRGLKTPAWRAEQWLCYASNAVGGIEGKKPKRSNKIMRLMQNFDTRMQIHPGIFL